MYNVKIKRFYDTEQVHIFSDCVLSPGTEKEDKRKFDLVTGEIYGLGHWARNPFVPEVYGPIPLDGSSRVDKLEVMKNMGDPEENLKRSVRRTKNAIFDISRSNKWDWFVTLTFNPEKVDSFDYAETTRKLSNWFIQMRRKSEDMKYLVVPERHPTSGRWHFHGLFADCDELGFVDGGKRDKKGRIVYNVGNYKLGWTEATKVRDSSKASSYITKYTTKELCLDIKGKKKYWHSKNCDKPIVETFFVSMDNVELKRVQEIADFRKTVQSKFIDVTYIELPIYTTNTTRFNTNEDEEMFPPHIGICESSEDNK